MLWSLAPLIAFSVRLNQRNISFLLSEGEKWQELRSAVSKGILKPSALVSHVDSMHEVAMEFIDKMKTIRREDGVIPNIEKELIKWAMECKYWGDTDKLGWGQI